MSRIKAEMTDVKSEERANKVTNMQRDLGRLSELRQTGELVILGLFPASSVESCQAPVLSEKPPL